MKKKATPRAPKIAKKPRVTGTYVYDKDLDRVVKVSDRIPGVSARGGQGESSGSPEDAGPCGSMECGGGSCAMPDGDLD